MHPTPVGILWRSAASAILSTGDYRAKSAVHGALAAVYILVHCPVSGVAYMEVCYSAYVKTSRSCDTASRVLERGTLSLALEIALV
ncbi:hypothetical protein [Desulfosporosinus sp. I2]|uniref:hypothetical protein n=1 Tax=Desulfosporosinus sp. I2 TaxID=1617025 RepID=UPI000A9CE0F5|nr:hypothetical protein [Desulfosporosinus sp. I2]